jgi:hypothetical protein
MDTLFYVMAAIVVVYALSRVVVGRMRYRKLRETFEAEGVLRTAQWVFTRFRFPLIKRITFSHVVLTRRRFAALHWCSMNKVLQAPLGAPGAVDADRNGFEVEARGKRKLLLLRTTIRGGGKIRFHVPDPDAWLEDIRRN